MKRYFYMAIALAGIYAGMSSCESNTRLAKDVAGSWQSDMMEYSNTASGEVRGMDNITFMAADNKATGGALTIVSALSLQRAAEPMAESNGASPFMITVAATASVSGTWSAVDDDDIEITLDRGSFALDIDPESVEMTVNPLSGVAQSHIDSIKPQVVNYYTADLSGIMLKHYQSYSRLEDVKVKDGGKMLRIEVNDRDMLLTRSEN